MKLSLSTSLSSFTKSAITFNPLSIGSIGEWFDYRSLSAVGDGNPISTWAGRKGLCTATQTGTARPTYVADAGDGRGAVLHDSVNDNMQFITTNADLYGTDGNFELWWVVKIPASSSTACDFFNSGFDTGTGVTMVDNPESSRWYFGVGGGGGQTSYGNAYGTHDDAWHVMRFVCNSGGNQWYVDGVNVGVIVFGSYTWNAGAVLCFLGGSAGTWNGSMRHLLTIKGSLDSPTAADLTSYLQAA